jgi:hypothetical protein
MLRNRKHLCAGWRKGENEGGEGRRQDRKSHRAYPSRFENRDVARGSSLIFRCRRGGVDLAQRMTVAGIIKFIFV